MKKAKKEYAKNNINGIDYLWKYLPEELNLFDRKVKIFGKTEKEIDTKFARKTAERRELIKQMMPENHTLKSVILAYFMYVKGDVRKLNEIEKMYKLSEDSIFGSNIDKDVEDITLEDISTFYNEQSKKYIKDDFKVLNKVIKKAFIISGAAGVTSITLEQLDEVFNNATSTSSTEGKEPEYIPTPEDLDKLLNFCLEGGTKKFWSNNKQKLTFVLLTGLNTSEAINAEVDIDKLPDIKVKGREFRIDEHTEEWLRNGLASGDLTLVDGRLFENTHTVKQAFFTTLRAMAAQCLIPTGISPHSLFKGMLVRKVNDGMPIEEVSERYAISVATINKYCAMYELQQNILSEMN